jgi:hypothetical protein
MATTRLLNFMARALATGLFLTVFCVRAPAQDQMTVFVPGNAGGDFGNPAVGSEPFVSAISVDRAGTVTVTYVSGRVTDIYDVDAGPEGVPCPDECAQLPLQEALGIGTSSIQDRTVEHLDALIGVFIPKTRVDAPGFSPVDGTKGTTEVGIIPSDLFLVGAGKTFQVGGAGTLYLGINDNYLSDNGGGFTVTVTGP